MMPCYRSSLVPWHGGKRTAVVSRLGLDASSTSLFDNSSPRWFSILFAEIPRFCGLWLFLGHDHIPSFADEVLTSSEVRTWNVPMGQR